MHLIGSQIKQELSDYSSCQKVAIIMANLSKTHDRLGRGGSTGSDVMLAVYFWLRTFVFQAFKSEI